MEPARAPSLRPSPAPTAPAAQATHTVFAGIDEAGLGPILGPLTIGYSVFRAPREAANLWKSLSPAVSRHRRRDKEAFVVADSKHVFQRSERSAARLETTALGFLALLDPARRPPTSAHDLLWQTPCELGPEAAAVGALPWYASPPVLPLHVDAGLLELRVEKLSRRMRRADVELLDAGLAVVTAGELNRSFAETGNKATTEWLTVARIVRRLWAAHGAEGLRLTVDRQGGRFHYGALLAQALPEGEVELVGETPARAEYVVRGRAAAAPGHRMRVTFAEKAEGRSFATALASCLAKYARELAMDQLNAYFGALQPGLKPTAGYRTDGWRWLEEAAPALAAASVDRRVLVRER
jgi:ribonuclease HII